MTPRTVATGGLRILAIWVLRDAFCGLFVAKTPPNTGQAFYKHLVELIGLLPDVESTFQSFDGMGEEISVGGHLRGKTSSGPRGNQFGFV